MQQKSSRGVQQHEVDAAADALVAQRLRPTIERVRERLGRGSPNTIAPMLETWFAGLSARLGVDQHEGGEPRPALVRRMADELWKASLSLAGEQASEALASEHAQVERERQALAVAQTALQEERSVFAQKQSHWEHELRQANERAALAGERTRALDAQLEASRAEFTQAQNLLREAATARESDIQQFQEQLRALTADRERIQERAAASERRNLEEVDRARQESKQLRRELGEARSKLQEQLQATDNERRGLQEQFAAAKAEITVLQERLAASERLAREYQALLKPHALQGPASGKATRRPVTTRGKVVARRNRGLR